MSARLNRREIKHDKFVDDMELAYGVAKKNVTRIVLAVAGVLVLAAAIYVFVVWQRKQEVKAQTQLAEAIRIWETPIGQPGPGGKIDFNTEQEKIAKAEPLFAKIVSDFGSRDAADVANLYLAQILGARGDVKGAEAKLDAFIKEHSDNLLAASARIGLYNIQIGSGKEGASRAIKALEQELSSAKNPLPVDTVLALLAQAYEVLGDDAKARDAYQRIVNEFPDSPYTLEAQRKIFRG